MKRYSMIFVLLLSCCLCGMAINSDNAEKTPVVIATEDGKVYVDPIRNVSAGDKLTVYINGGYFTHPITKEKIPRDSKDVAELQVEKVFSSYIQTVPKPAMAISQIEQGMMVRKQEQSLSSAPTQQQVTSMASQSSVYNQPANDVKSREQAIIAHFDEFNKICPTKRDNDQCTLKYAIEEKIIYQHNIIFKKTNYRMLSKTLTDNKSLIKFRRELYNIIVKDPLLADAEALGYKYVMRFWNPDVTEYVDITVFG